MRYLIRILLAALLAFGVNWLNESKDNGNIITENNGQKKVIQNALMLPEYTGKAWTVINNNIPVFTETEKNKKQSEIRMTELDKTGRCGPFNAVLGPETLPKEKRKPIGMVKPTGWKIAKYDFVDQKFLYNRCHLGGFQLTGINNDPRNLITGTRYMNVIGMLPYENYIADYIRRTKNHVLFRSTPHFKNNEMVARGVQMEAWSLEDNGKLKFNIYCHNIQPGVIIDYKNGNSKKENK